MRTILIILLCISIVPACFAVEEIETFVNDYAGILTPEEEMAISVLAQEMFDTGDVQYAVMTVNNLSELPIEEYAIQAAQGNLGDAEKDNGVLLLIAITERQYRFEVGSGAEGTLNDAKVGRLGRTYLVPAFQQGEYGKGILEATTALHAIYVKGEEPVAMQEVRIPLWKQPGFWFFILFIIMIVLRGFESKRKKKNKYFDAADGLALLLGGGRGGSGGDSGGFGGFGGGGFSGGGSSGDW